MEALKIARTYAGMLQRCYEEKSKSYANYGGRGITICDEWLNDPGKFFSWCAEQGSTKGKQLDRLDNSLGYSPDNCAFVSPKENVRNRRNTIFLVAWGESKPLAAWPEDDRAAEGLTYPGLYDRVSRGWDPVDAITTPVKKFKNLEAEKTVTQVSQGAHPDDPVYEYDGEEKTLAEWAKDPRAAVDSSLMWSRIYGTNWPFEKALLTPPAANKGILFEGKTISEWANDPACPMSYNTLARRLKSGMSVSEAFAKPVIMGNQKQKPA